KAAQRVPDCRCEIGISENGGGGRMLWSRRAILGARDRRGGRNHHGHRSKRCLIWNVQGCAGLAWMANSKALTWQRYVRLPLMRPITPATCDGAAADPRRPIAPLVEQTQHGAMASPVISVAPFSSTEAMESPATVTIPFSAA